MSDAIPVEIPLVNVNDETVKLTAWLVQDGEDVREGQNLAELETSKALVELAAPASGRIHIRIAAGNEPAVGTVVAYIGADAPATTPVQRAASTLGSPLPMSLSPVPGILPSGTRFSKKALELLARHNLSAELFRDFTMVREQDILALVNRAAAASAEQLHHAMKGISLDGLTLPALFAECSTGHLDPEFLQSLRKNPETIASLPSAEKCRLYREHGAVIGDDVIFGQGTILVAPQIQLGDRVRIGENGSLILRERLAISAWSSFREGLSIRGGTAVFGKSTFAGKRILIGGGGNADPWALLVVGDNVYLGDDLFINICRPILLGKEVFLTQRSVLVTHNIGHSILEGWENTFAPIILEDFSQVGMNSTLYAGSRVGHSAIVGSNSYVISSIPRGKLAMGVPARVVRDAVRPIDRKKQLQIAETMVRQFQELLILKGVEASTIETQPILQFTARYQGKSYRLAFIESLAHLSSSSSGADESVVWTFESSATSPSSSWVIMDLLAKTISGPSGMFSDSAREFLRKRGIRLQPGPWLYQRGLI
jgi:acetyltransferase-like isoleucine patch superfamily enzyme